MRDETNFVSGWLVPTAIAIVLTMMASLTMAAEKAPAKPVEPTLTWKGSIDDVALMAKSPASHVISDAKSWEALRDAWKLPDESKDVNFDKQLVLVGVTHGGLINGKPTLSDDGDLRIGFISTRDLRPGFRYLILVVAKDGVKTVNGKAI